MNNCVVESVEDCLEPVRMHLPTVSSKVLFVFPTRTEEGKLNLALNELQLEGLLWALHLLSASTSWIRRQVINLRKFFPVFCVGTMALLVVMWKRGELTSPWQIGASPCVFANPFILLPPFKQGEGKLDVGRCTSCNGSPKVSPLSFRRVSFRRETHFGVLFTKAVTQFHAEKLSDGFFAAQSNCHPDACAHGRIFCLTQANCRERFG